LYFTTGYSQTVLQDFSNLGNTATVAVFGGFGAGLDLSEDLETDPVDASNKVRKVTTTAGGDAWKGVFFRPQTHYIDLTTNKSVSIKIYSTTANYFKGKIQDGQNSQNDIELTTSESHTGSGWETLTFTFLSATGDYGELAIFTSADANGSFVAQEGTLVAYFDDLTAVQGSAISVPSHPMPDDSPSTPTHESDDVISLFSDTYTDISMVTFRTDWSTITSASDNFIANNAVKAYNSEGYAGIIPSANIDASAMEYISFDYWASDVTSFKLKLESTGNVSNEVADLTATTGSWETISIPLTSYPLVDLADIGVIVFSAVGNTNPVYIDNIYFWKEPIAEGTDASLSDLNVNGTIVTNFSPSTFAYTVGIAVGASVPEVTASATDANVTSVTITQATAVPGEASVVVVSQDGSVTNEYTISFVFEGPSEAAPTPPARNAEDVVSLFNKTFSCNGNRLSSMVKNILLLISVYNIKKLNIHNIRINKEDGLKILVFIVVKKIFKIIKYNNKYQRFVQSMKKLFI
jgi:hypothetical protein